ncbi:alpha/beta hydrolase fold protein [Phialemonium atrogriseum]|uniref:Alpha/beta hydrolase fold protein n=1 Tax=Phialemonium atrogriseum TaxID=1093897 RepID=A0AAJ0BXE0_9PEZI|nr:alpha/beta hydrolase fold protein [Phialemonium atrogriseum]KAK1765168.1 alpha/beta hydrolase fold protein [Phialemonium atrogriseum]
MAPTKVSYAEADGVKVFYRYAGPITPAAKTILLLHGFPSSSHMFRNLIPLLASSGYTVIAPDLPGFGFTDVPAGRSYTYTFAALATTIESFVDALKLKRFAIYIFDYGAPVGLRLATKNPERVAAIVSQNGNAYVEGLGADFWAPIKKYWATGSDTDRNALRPALELGVTRWQYEDGSPHPQKIQPEAYHLDQALLDRPGNKDIQLDIFYDYRTNLDLYPAFQEYFRTSGVPILSVWGKNDTIFIAPGAEAFARDAKKSELRFLDAGHFALETNEEEMAGFMHEFFQKHKVFQA